MRKICQWVREHIARYVDKDLSLNDDHKMRTHLRLCESCRKDKDTEVALKDALDESREG